MPARCTGARGTGIQRTLAHPPIAALLLSVAAGVNALPAQRPAPTAATGPILSHTHWSYEFMEALDLLGGTSAWMTTVRSQPREALTREMARADRFALGSSERATLDPVRRAWQQALLREAGYGFMEVGTRTGDALLNPGRGTFVGARGEAQLGPRVSVWGEGQWGAYERFDGVRAGGISLPIGPLTYSALREPLRGATTASGNVMFGGEVPLDLFHVASNRPIRLPIVESILGPGEGVLAIGPFGGLSQPEQGVVALWSLRSRPSKHFRIGAARAIQMGRALSVDSLGGGAMTASRVARSLFLKVNEPPDWDDQKAELSLEWRLNALGRPFAPYLVFSQEDAPPYLDPGFHAGVRTAGVNARGLWMLRYEYLGIGNRGKWCSFCERVTHESGGGLSESGREQGTWYRHGRIGWLYAREGIPLGESLGGYGSRHRVDAWFWPSSAGYRVRGWAFEEYREPLNLLAARWPGLRRGIGVEGTVLRAAGAELTGTGLVASNEKVGTEWGWSLAARMRFGTYDGMQRAAKRSLAAAREPLTPAVQRTLAERLALLPSGTRVEITSPAILQEVGRGSLLAAQDSGVLRLDDGGRTPLTVPLAHIERVRIADRPARATWVGLAVGTLAGFVVGVYVDEETSRNIKVPRPGIRATGTVIGAVAGSAVGWHLMLPRWRELTF